MKIIQSHSNIIVQQYYRPHMDLYNQGSSISELSTSAFWKTCIKCVLLETNI